MGRKEITFSTIAGFCLLLWVIIKGFQILFIISLFLILLSVIVGITMLIAQSYNNIIYPIAGIIIFLLMAFVSYQIGYALPNSEMGKTLIVEPANIILKADSDMNCQGIFPFIELNKENYDGHWEYYTINVTEEKTKIEYYQEEVPYVVGNYMQSIYGENISELRLSTTDKTKCNQTSCQLSLTFINTKHNFSIPFKAIIPVLIKNMPNSTIIFHASKEITIDDNDIMDYSFTINNDIIPVPYNAEIILNNITFEIGDNDFIKQKDILDFKLENRTNETKYNVVIPEEKKTWIVDDSSYNLMKFFFCDWTPQI
jgi:hypothetical protein